MRARRGSRLRLLLCGLILSLLSTVVWVSTPAAQASRLTEITIPALPGQIPDIWLGAVLNAKYAAPYPGPPRAKVLLPAGYDPSKKYPLLVLLAGASSDYRTWSQDALGRITTTAAGFPGIIVMPEGGTGFYTDWWQGSPQWESYYTDVVIPEIMKRFPIRSERRWHAIAGVSMGGLGAAYLGGRLPQFFGSVAIISGLVDTDLFRGMPNLAALVPELNAKQPPDLNALYGPLDGAYAVGHNPVRLAANLGQTRVFMATGDGRPTSDGEPNDNNLLSDLPVELALIHPASDAYITALRAARVDATYQAHAGIHDFANFRKELRDASTWNLFAPAVERPDRWVNDTVATHGSLWGFDYRFDRRPTEVVRLQRDANLLRIGAAGTAVTITGGSGCVVHTATPATLDLTRTNCQ
ncbi:alpha/beta hydrolase [Jongsikchunia kroppenstedtii]|uniref:alpha/beta hydrolase n=1 Tax=Jongsikchunia kroppenstedtii TaxID=1121721 RepID=UPI0003682248|nr:alpha/beta hydrolase-fold protein [Jongsikchunia kroppenstedtii]